MIKHFASLTFVLVSGCASPYLIDQTPAQANSSQDVSSYDLMPYPREQAREQIQLRLKDYRACYEAELKLNPKAAGKMVIEWTIGVGGKVTKAEVKSAESPIHFISRTNFARIYETASFTFDSSDCFRLCKPRRS